MGLVIGSWSCLYCFFLLTLLLQRAVPPTGYRPSQTSSVWVLPTGWSPSGVECPSVGPTRKPAPEGLLSRSCSSCQEPTPKGSSFLQSICACSAVGCSKGCRVDIYSTMVLHGLQGEESASQESPPQAAGSAPAPGAPPCFPPSGLDFCSCFSLLSLTPFSKHTQRCHQCEGLTQLGLCSVSPGAAWSCLHPMWGQLPISSARSHPLQLPAPKSCHINSTQTCTQQSIRADFDLDSSSDSPLDNNSHLLSFSFTLCGFSFFFFLVFDRLRYFISSFYLLNNGY